MKNDFVRTTTLALVAFTVAFSLSSCNLATRLSEVGDGPKLSAIENPILGVSYEPVSLPMPAPRATEANPNSLWRSGARAFFKDHRAKEIGDIVTVKLDIEDSAELESTTGRARKDSEDFDLNDLIGFEDELTKMLPEGIDSPGQIVNFAQEHATSGKGDIDRSETISLTFAAVVTQILPNGSLVVMGRQEVLVNAEMRELMVTGIIRPEDIESDNTISHEKIAEMRIAYGGRGTLSQLQQPRWGMQLWDIVFPF